MTQTMTVVCVMAANRSQGLSIRAALHVGRTTKTDQTKACRTATTGRTFRLNAALNHAAVAPASARSDTQPAIVHPAPRAAIRWTLHQSNLIVTLTSGAR